MRVFISSVRKGLEEERDSLPGLITALGYTPVRFEDFSAQATPSREACLHALESSDVCLVLLGPNYGHVFPETGQSATHDEWVHAQKLGMPRLVYRKTGVMFEPEQHEFTRLVEAYATGLFRDSFRNTSELQVKVVQALRELSSKPSVLEFKRLTYSPVVSWIADANGENSSSISQGALLEVHILPLDRHGYSAREMELFTESLTNRVRGTRYISDDVALRVSKSRDHAVVNIESGRRPAWDKPQTWRIVEVRLYGTGQISVRATLPRDQMGSILDTEALPKQIAEMLRLAGALGIIQQEHVAVAVGVSPNSLISVDTFDPNRSRSRAQPLGFGRQLGMLRTEPDEAVSLAALGNGADEAADSLARVLFAQIAT
ncbi:DUF4062 domain-containing protein [Actinospica robiniae]|uniref:DUF4062 domain-containing protein n=1 Tax=Actinospica robiniae TaxID=304901 RepID=UPI00041D04CA|nr:DUF4062 domain-containing protein [Actinospica robiniae]